MGHDNKVTRKGTPAATTATTATATTSTNPAAQKPSALAPAAAANTAPADDPASSAGQWKEALVAFLIKTAPAALGAILAGLVSSSVVGGWPGAVGCLLGACSMGIYWRGLLEETRVEAARREGRREGFEAGRNSV
ncbi:hypothetical protein DL770_003203 [Monosporascus sp. CRB-9-2]|nr:hypothetical protein DL770_003203 [Monosporascus sp. CRB-9-2]